MHSRKFRIIITFVAFTVALGLFLYPRIFLGEIPEWAEVGYGSTPQKSRTFNRNIQAHFPPEYPAIVFRYELERAGFKIMPGVIGGDQYWAIRRDEGNPCDAERIVRWTISGKILTGVDGEYMLYCN